MDLSSDSESDSWADDPLSTSDESLLDSTDGHPQSEEASAACSDAEKPLPGGEELEQSAGKRTGSRPEHEQRTAKDRNHKEQTTQEGKATSLAGKSGSRTPVTALSASTTTETECAEAHSSSADARRSKHKKKEKSKKKEDKKITQHVTTSSDRSTDEEGVSPTLAASSQPSGEFAPSSSLKRAPEGETTKVAATPSRVVAMVIDAAAPLSASVHEGDDEEYVSESEDTSSYYFQDTESDDDDDLFSWDTQAANHRDSSDSEDYDVNDPNIDEKRRQKLSHKREKRKQKAEKKATKLREKREKYARKQEKKKKKKYRKVGKLITKEDPSYELMFDMLLGIRICVSRVSAKRLKKRQLTDHDFRERYDVALPAKGTPETPAHPCRDFTFRDYAPRVFRLIREKFGIDSADYLVSLTGEYILQEIISPGKSGSFFYFSHDTRYMLKTITPMETAFLKKILPAYTEHIMDHPDTLLIKFYGFHCVNMRGRGKAHFVVMGNIFAQSLAIHRRYDLKGSSVGRTVGPTKRGAEGVTMKDLDLEDDIVFGPANRAVFFATMESDADFCASQGIMDYSLLLGVHSETLAHKRRKERERQRLERDRQKMELRATAALANEGSASESSSEDESDEEDDEFVMFGRPTFFTQHHGGIRATDEQDQPLSVIYFMGIIDILQPYNASKRAEHAFKSIRHDRMEISAVPPRPYAERFKQFFRQKTSTERADALRIRPKRKRISGRFAEVAGPSSLPEDVIDDEAHSLKKKELSGTAYSVGKDPRKRSNDRASASSGAASVKEKPAKKNEPAAEVPAVAQQPSEPQQAVSKKNKSRGSHSSKQRKDVQGKKNKEAHSCTKSKEAHSSKKSQATHTRKKSKEAHSDEKSNAAHSDKKSRGSRTGKHKDAQISRKGNHSDATNSQSGKEQVDDSSGGAQHHHHQHHHHHQRKEKSASKRKTHGD